MLGKFSYSNVREKLQFVMQHEPSIHLNYWLTSYSSLLEWCAKHSLVQYSSIQSQPTINNKLTEIYICVSVVCFG